MDTSYRLKLLGFQHNIQQYFSYIMAVSFISGGNLEYPEKATDRPKVTDKIYHIVSYEVKLIKVKPTQFYLITLQLANIWKWTWVLPSEPVSSLFPSLTLQACI